MPSEVKTAQKQFFLHGGEFFIRWHVQFVTNRFNWNDNLTVDSKKVMSMSECLNYNNQWYFRDLMLELKFRLISILWIVKGRLRFFSFFDFLPSPLSQRVRFLAPLDAYRPRKFDLYDVDLVPNVLYNPHSHWRHATSLPNLS